GWLAHVAGSRGKALLDATVGRDGGKHAAPADDRREQDHAAIRGEAWGFVAVAVGEDLHLPVREVEQRHLEAARVARNVGEHLAVRGEPRRHIIATLEGDALRLAAVRAHAV